MRQRCLGFGVVLVVAGLAACSADEGGSSTRGRPAGPIGPTVGTAGSGSAAAGRGDPSFGNPTNPSMMSVGNPSGPVNPANLCEVVHLTAKPSTPDILIVLDRSGSMQKEGRWMPSVQR